MRFQSMYADLFGNTASEAGQPAHLQELVKQYPYFSLAHFFLLDNMVEGTDNYASIASKTALHFNNPFLLNEHMHPPKENNIPAKEQVAPMESLHGENSVEITSQPQTNLELNSRDGYTILPTVEAEPGKPDPDSFINVSPGDDTVPVPDKTEPEIILPSNNAPVSQPADVTAADDIKPEAPIFEPLSASDYFASQGIKLSEEQQPADRMGQQLKSFTAWLKTMKKVHETRTPVGDAPVDVTVQTLAEKSNTGEEVVTEAMAEVFLQQGKGNKARDIYQKLSLLNPTKSAYFAAKLEQIK